MRMMTNVLFDNFLVCFVVNAGTSMHSLVEIPNTKVIIPSEFSYFQNVDLVVEMNIFVSVFLQRPRVENYFQVLLHYQRQVYFHFIVTNSYPIYSGYLKNKLVRDSNGPNGSSP